MTAGTLNLVELGEVVDTRDKLTVPIWTAWLPRWLRFFQARRPWVITWGESCERAKGAEKAS